MGKQKKTNILNEVRRVMGGGKHCSIHTERTYCDLVGKGEGVGSSLECFVLLMYEVDMSRPLRIEYPSAWYHGMNRGRRGEDVFSDRKDCVTFLTVLQEAALMFDARVAAYCLMSNHYHFLLQTPVGNLSRSMRHINGVYTQRYNRRWNTDGQLFLGRLKKGC